MKDAERGGSVLVARLRAQVADWWRAPDAPVPVLLREAADEIERLRAALQRIADAGCEHFYSLRCADQPHAYTVDSEDWATRTCNPCAALLALKAATAPHPPEKDLVNPTPKTI